MVAEGLSSSALQRHARARADRALSRRRARRRGGCSSNRRRTSAGRCSCTSRRCGSSRSICARAARWPWRRRTGRRRRFLSVARASARRIAAERMPWSDPIALLLQRRHRVGRGQARPTALACLQDAADRVRSRRHGALRGRRPAPPRRAAGRRARPASCSGRPTRGWRRSRSRTPSAMTRMLAPGFPDLP